MEEDWWKTSCVKTCCTFHVPGSRVQSTAVSIWIVIWNGQRDLVGFCNHDNCWVSFYGYQFTYVYITWKGPLKWVSLFDPTHLHELINTGPQRQKFTSITTTVIFGPHFCRKIRGGAPPWIRHCILLLNCFESGLRSSRKKRGRIFRTSVV